MLSLPELKGVPWVPGAGQRAVAHWPEVYRKIRRAGKLIQIFDLWALDQRGLADNTLVIVTSDHGAHIRSGGFDFEREFGDRRNHLFCGQKSDVWDGGHRVPFLARWPDRIPAGERMQ